MCTHTHILMYVDRHVAFYGSLSSSSRESSSARCNSESSASARARESPNCIKEINWGGESIPKHSMQRMIV